MTRVSPHPKPPTLRPHQDAHITQPDNTVMRAGSTTKHQEPTAKTTMFLIQAEAERTLELLRHLPKVLMEGQTVMTPQHLVIVQALNMAQLLSQIKVRSIY